MGSAQAPVCMACNTRYTTEILEEGFTKTFMNEVYDEQARLFKESQRSLLPSTMPYIQRQIEGERLTLDLQTMDRDINEVTLELNNMKMARRRLEIQIHNARNAHLWINNNPDEGIPDEFIVNEISGESSFVVSCPYDDCRGYLSRRYKCDVCEKWMCPRCQKPKNAHDDPDHVCIEADVLSVAEIKKTTKGCPKCGTRIHKISGCSQMFCTKPDCGTIFDWNTLRIQTKGPEHNPHIHAWRERHGVTQMNGEDGCLDVQTWHISNAMRATNDKYRTTYKMHLEKLIDATRYKNHVVGVDLRDIQHNNYDTQLRLLRMRYLRNRITEDEWTKNIKSIHRLTRKNDDYMAVLGFVPDVLNDLIREQLNNLNNRRPIQFDTIVEFAEITNDNLRQLNRKYSVKGKILNVVYLGKYLITPVES